MIYLIKMVQNSSLLLSSPSNYVPKLLAKSYFNFWFDQNENYLPVLGNVKFSALIRDLENDLDRRSKYALYPSKVVENGDFQRGQKLMTKPPTFIQHFIMMNWQ